VKHLSGQCELEETQAVGRLRRRSHVGLKLCDGEHRVLVQEGPCVWCEEHIPTSEDGSQATPHALHELGLDNLAWYESAIPDVEESALVLTVQTVDEELNDAEEIMVEVHVANCFPLVLSDTAEDAFAGLHVDGGVAVKLWHDTPSERIQPELPCIRLVIGQQVPRVPTHKQKISCSKPDANAGLHKSPGSLRQPNASARVDEHVSEASERNAERKVKVAEEAVLLSGMMFKIFGGDSLKFHARRAGISTAKSCVSALSKITCPPRGESRGGMKRCNQRREKGRSHAPSLMTTSYQSRRSHAYGVHKRPASEERKLRAQSRTRGFVLRTHDAMFLLPFRDLRKHGRLLRRVPVYMGAQNGKYGAACDEGGSYPCFPAFDVEGKQLVHKILAQQKESCGAKSTQHVVRQTAASLVLMARALLALADTRPDLAASTRAARMVLQRLQEARVNCQTATFRAIAVARYGFSTEMPITDNMFTFLKNKHQTMSFGPCANHVDVCGEGLESVVAVSLSASSDASSSSVLLSPTGSVQLPVLSALVWPVYKVSTLLGAIGNGDEDGDVEVHDCRTPLTLHGSLATSSGNRGVYVRSLGKVLDGGALCDHPSVGTLEGQARNSGVQRMTLGQLRDAVVRLLR